MSYTLEVLYATHNAFTGRPTGEYAVVATREADHGTKQAEVLAVALDESDEQAFLESVWREFNNVDGDEMNVRLGLRSMSVGDRVRISYRYEAWNAITEGSITWEAVAVGWKRVGNEETFTEIPLEDREVLVPAPVEITGALGEIDEDGYRSVSILINGQVDESHYLRYDVASQWLAQELDIRQAFQQHGTAECEHGLSLALCAGPGHYPDDYEGGW